VRIVLVSAAWRRFEVTRLALAQRRHLCGELAGRGHEATGVIVADDDNLDIADEYGFVGLYQTNDYLGRKFNDGIEHACRKLDADFVVFLGSDDWCHIDLFDRLPDPNPPMPIPTDDNPVVVWSGHPEAITGREIAVVNMETGRLRRCTNQGRSGVIPWIMPRRMFDKCGYRPIRETQQRGIDFALVSGLGYQPAWVWTDPHDLCRVDFKTSVNLTAYDDASDQRGYGDEESDPWAALAERYPAHLCDMGRETQQRMAAVAA
jgi:hypothetical protein